MSIKNKSISVDLKDYRLYFDGSVEAYDVEDTFKLFLLGLSSDKIKVKEGASCDDIDIFNKLIENDNQQLISIDAQSIIGSINKDEFLLPKEIIDLDLRSFILAKLDENNVFEKTSNDYRIRLDRVEQELKEIENRKIENLFKTIIFIVDNFEKHNQVFGIGRGSSCACYILYLIGLNLVDPIKWNLPISEFFH